MDFLKKHYEKVLFGVVLLGLVGAMVGLPFLILHDRAILDNTRVSITSFSAKPLPPLDLAEESNAVAQLQKPFHLDFEATNRLFNPVEWVRAQDGSLIKVASGNEIGPRAVKVTKITPLYFILTLDSVDTNFGVRYAIGVQRQAAREPWQQARRQHYASVGEKNNDFTITGVEGPPANPTQLTLQLTDTGETVTLSKNKPYRRVDGYMADLKYPPEDKSWQDVRKGADLKFAGDNYFVVAINQNQVVLLAQSNQKKTTLHYKSP